MALPIPNLLPSGHMTGPDDCPPLCAATLPLPPPPAAQALLDQPLAAVDDLEGARLPASWPATIDAHVHLFPDRVFAAIWSWFDKHGWPIRYKLQTPGVIRFLLERGVERLVALHYAHKPGIARGLNTYLAQVCRQEPRVHGVATVYPGEEGAAAILEEGFAMGLRGVKLHCHVQAFAADHDSLHEIYATCIKHDAPLVMHAGREPRSAAYPVDTHTLCDAERVERVLRGYPKLRLCVPHLGADEFDAYGVLLERHDNLWLDTTMMLADYFPLATPERIVTMRPGRVMYGSDFPNLPYAWDRELTRVTRYERRDDALAALMGGTARGFFGLPG